MIASNGGFLDASDSANSSYERPHIEWRAGNIYTVRSLRGGDRSGSVYDGRTRYALFDPDVFISV